MNVQLMLGVTATLGAATAASGQIVTTPPFVGLMREGFEDVPGYSCPPCFFVCLGVFGGAAEACDDSGTNGLNITPSWALQCTMNAHVGKEFLGSAGGPVAFTFDEPLKRFGGYFGDVGLQGSGTVEFYDAFGFEIGPPLQLQLNACNWVWNGWETTGPGIARVKIFGSATGAFVMMDDLEAEGAGGGCYPDCDSNQQLTIADFACFQTAFRNNSLYADCNGDSALTIGDFGCFQASFVTGCP